MRSSDFDAYSMYGEVIDNSIQAGVKNIGVHFSFQPKAGNQFEPVTKLPSWTTAMAWRLRSFIGAPNLGTPTGTTAERALVGSGLE